MSRWNVQIKVGDHFRNPRGRLYRIESFTEDHGPFDDVMIRDVAEPDGPVAYGSACSGLMIPANGWKSVVLS